MKSAQSTDMLPARKSVISGNELKMGEAENVQENGVVGTINWLIQLYYERVHYKTECLLLLLYFLPSITLCLVLLFVQNLKFPTTLISIGFTVLLSFIGMIASYGTDIINERHARLETMGVILSGDATIRTLCDCISGNRKNVYFKVVGIPC
jgi:hypothetical protein